MDQQNELQMAAITLGSLLYPKDMKKLAKSHVTILTCFPDEDARVEYLTKFHDALYCFSMQKVIEFLDNRYIAFFLKLFIQTIHSRDSVQEIMSIFEKSYSKALTIL
jgi:hypothetical protein